MNGTGRTARVPRGALGREGRGAGVPGGGLGVASDVASAVVRLRALPEIGARIPGFVPHVLFAIVAALLCFDRLAPGFWLVVGLVLTALAIVVPHRLAAWALVFVLGASLVMHGPVLDVPFFLLLAGLHALHVLAAQMLVLPVRGWVQLAVFARPLLRFLAIQVPVQALAVLVLIFAPPDSARSAEGSSGIGAAGSIMALPVFAIVASAALLVVTLVLLVPLLREQER